MILSEREALHIWLNDTGGEMSKKRASEMLRVSAEYIRQYWDEGIVVYDGAECDGACVADDCEFAADELDRRAEPAPKPVEYAHGWQVSMGVRCVSCPDCAFTFDADHEDAKGGGYTCPNCAPESSSGDDWLAADLRQELDSLRSGQPEGGVVVYADFRVGTDWSNHDDPAATIFRDPMDGTTRVPFLLARLRAAGKGEGDVG